MPNIDIIVTPITTVIDVITQQAGTVGPRGPQGDAGPQGEIGPQGPPAGVIVSINPPASPVEGQLWFDSDSGALLISYDNTWVQVNLLPEAIGIVTHDGVTVVHGGETTTHAEV